MGESYAASVYFMLGCMCHGRKSLKQQVYILHLAARVMGESYAASVYFMLDCMCHGRKSLKRRVCVLCLAACVMEERAFCGKCISRLAASVMEHFTLDCVWHGKRALNACADRYLWVVFFTLSEPRAANV